MKANPVDIFNYEVENLPNGESLSVDCDTEGQLDRIRMALYRQRNKLEKLAPGIAATITISKRVDNKSYSIVIGKNAENIELFTFDSEGKKLPLELKSRLDENKKERLTKMMREAGKSEEEIEEYFQNNKNSQ